MDRNHFNAYVWKTAVWKTALAASGIEPSRANGMHALRHFYVSVLLDAGESIKALSEYLGHSDPGLTLRTYTHLLPTSEQRTRQAVDRPSREWSNGRRPAHGPGAGLTRSSAGQPPGTPRCRRSVRGAPATCGNAGNGPLTRQEAYASSFIVARQLSALCGPDVALPWPAVRPRALVLAFSGAARDCNAPAPWDTRSYPSCPRMTLPSPACAAGRCHPGQRSQPPDPRGPPSQPAGRARRPRGPRRPGPLGRAPGGAAALTPGSTMTSSRPCGGCGPPSASSRSSRLSATTRRRRRMSQYKGRGWRNRGG
jgi:hypothetical protein